MRKSRRYKVSSTFTQCKCTPFYILGDCNKTVPRRFPDAHNRALTIADGRFVRALFQAVEWNKGITGITPWFHLSFVKWGRFAPRLEPITTSDRASRTGRLFYGRCTRGCPSHGALVCGHVTWTVRHLITGGRCNTPPPTTIKARETRWQCIPVPRASYVHVPTSPEFCLTCPV